MAYVLHGGPRDRQLVDDLPWGYRPIDGPVPDPGFVPLDGIPIDAAVWDAGERRARIERRGEPRPKLRAL
jgi:hypothetical protein